MPTYELHYRVPGFFMMSGIPTGHHSDTVIIANFRASNDKDARKKAAAFLAKKIPTDKSFRSKKPVRVKPVELTRVIKVWSKYQNREFGTTVHRVSRLR